MVGYLVMREQHAGATLTGEERAAGSSLFLMVAQVTAQMASFTNTLQGRLLIFHLSLVHNLQIRFWVKHFHGGFKNEYPPPFQHQMGCCFRCVLTL